MAISVDRRQDWDKVLSGVDTVIFDCDGVLWLGNNDCVPGAQDLVRTLKQNGKNVCFVTNNSSKSRRQYLEKFTKLKFDSVKAEDIHSPASVAGVFLKDILKIEGKVYLLGMEGFGEELDLMGLEYFGPGLDPFTGSLEEWSKYEYDPKVRAVVVGYDAHFSYMKMMKAATYIAKHNCLFVATNMDAQLPTRSDCASTIPGAGSFVSALSHVLQKEPDYILGKPNKPMFDAVKEVVKLEPSRTLMIGDSFSTDILFGNRFGMKTILVLSGIAKREDLSSVDKEQMPQYVSESISTYFN
jgi:phosphoglycolate phosphatase